MRIGASFGLGAAHQTGPLFEVNSRSRVGAGRIIYTSYPQHIHNLKTLELVLFTGTCCARIHKGAAEIETLVARVPTEIVKWANRERG
jgi:hypothetical protein